MINIFVLERITGKRNIVLFVKTNGNAVMNITMRGSNMNPYRCETCKHNSGMPQRPCTIIFEEEKSSLQIGIPFYMDILGYASHSEFRADCIWMEDDDGIYQTSCGNAFEFMNGTPDDNHMKFCPYCGKLLRQKDGKKFRDTTNDDENVDYRGYFDGD